jgi:hypothetical protein
MVGLSAHPSAMLAEGSKALKGAAPAALGWLGVLACSSSRGAKRRGDLRSHDRFVLATGDGFAVLAMTKAAIPAQVAA